MMENINLKKEKEVKKKSIFWNMVFSILSSLQSAILLLFVTRMRGTEEAGILSIAFATAYLMFTIGTYGVRNFQVTDSQKYYTYYDYKKMRMFSCSIMVIISLFYCVWKDYEVYKTSIILSICLLKLLEAVEDLYHGEFQRIGRLDIAGCLGTIRLLMNYFTFFLALIFTNNLLIAIFGMFFLSFVVIMANKILLKVLFIKNERKKEKSKWIKLVVSCFPLFLTLFFSIYISNSPKYAIDLCLTEEEQAYYAILSMPVFTINLLSGILYRPKLLDMAQAWNKKEKEKFKRIILKQIENIIVISFMILIGGITVGLKLLEILYGVSLSPFKMEFVLLLIGGGMVASYNFFIACITIMRKQSFLIWLSIFMVILAYNISNSFVYKAGLIGAAWAYLILMICEMGIVFLAFWIYLKREIDNNKKNSSY